MHSSDEHAFSREKAMNDGLDYTAVKCVDIFALYISQCCVVWISKKELLL